MSVTVGICAYNEEKNIGTLLWNILNEQELPEKSEVLVVCSGCTDNTVDIVQRYAEKDPRVKIFIEQSRRGKASAVNQVLKNAKCQNILFVSADTIPHKNCFARLISALQFSNVGLVCAKPEPINGSDSLAGSMVHVLWGLHNDIFELLDENNQAGHASEVFCFRKHIAESIPGDTVNDDAYIALMAKKKGWLVRYDNRSLVSICGPETISDYVKQRRRVICGHYQLRRQAGTPPQYFSGIMRLRWREKVSVLQSTLRKHGIRNVATFVLMESYLNVLAMNDLMRGKSYLVWNTATSTKTPFSLQNGANSKRSNMENYKWPSSKTR